MRKRRRGMRPDQLELAASARAMGLPWHEIAAMFRSRFRVNGLVAMRLAHGWSQRDAADEWNRRWPDDIKTFKNFSYWENWPSPTGYAPSLVVLGRLCELYECAITDLLSGGADFRHADPFFGANPEVSSAPPSQALAVALEGICGRLAGAEVEEVAAAGLVWAEKLPQTHSAYGLLMKLSAGLALAATAQSGLLAVSQPVATGQESTVESGAAVEGDSENPAPAGEGVPAAGVEGTDSGGEESDLVGIWRSRCQRSAPSLPNDHVVVLRNNRGRLLGQSLPHPAGARLRLDLDVDDRVLSGTWVEHGAGEGAPTFQGTVRLILDGSRRTMRGRWIGFGAEGFQVRSGAWEMSFMEPSLSGSVLLAHRATA
jgi:hypothetical protein